MSRTSWGDVKTEGERGQEKASNGGCGSGGGRFGHVGDLIPDLKFVRAHLQNFDCDGFDPRVCRVLELLEEPKNGWADRN